MIVGWHTSRDNIRGDFQNNAKKMEHSRFMIRQLLLMINMYGPSGPARPFSRWGGGGCRI